MKPAHGDLKGNAGAYVLGSLDADERTAFESHLSSCAECAAEVRSLRRVADALAHGVPQRTPSPELRQRVLDSLEAKPVVLAPGRGIPRTTNWNWLPIAALLVLTLGIGVYALRLLTPDASGGGTTFYNTPPDIPPPTAVAVTIEPAGGLPSPTGAFYLLGAPVAAL